MDKKLKRQILFNKKSGSVISKEETVKPAKEKALAQKNDVSPERIFEWLKSHPYFKWSSMCKDLKIDKGNFARTMNALSPKLPDDVCVKITSVLKEYGYAK